MRWVLLPGMDGVGLFQPLMEVLGPQQDCLVLSYPADLPLGYEQLTVRVRELLRVETDYILVAESFSGPIAIALAAENPPGLRALVLAASFCRAPVHGLKARLLKKFGGALFRIRPPLWAVKHFLLGDAASQQMIDDLYAAISRVSAETLNYRLREILNVNVCNHCAEILVPVLYLQAIGDRLVGQQEAEIIQHSCQQFELHQIDASHMVLQRQPALSCSAIKDFLSHHKIFPAQP